MHKLVLQLKLPVKLHKTDKYKCQVKNVWEVLGKNKKRNISISFQKEQTGYSSGRFTIDLTGY